MGSEVVNFKLLVIDDEQGMVDLLRRMMEPICSWIDSTDNLAEGLEMAERNRYNLIILDLRLNGTGKEEALEAIHKFKECYAGVVVVSGMKDDNLRDECLKAGADAFVPKGENQIVRSMMIAANVAVMHLPEQSPRSDTFMSHVNMLSQMATA